MGTNSWAAIGAATTASDIAMGAKSLSEAATPKLGAPPEATQATGATNTGSSRAIIFGIT